MAAYDPLAATRIAAVVYQWLSPTTRVSVPDKRGACWCAFTPTRGSEPRVQNRQCQSMHKLDRLTCGTHTPRTAEVHWWALEHASPDSEEWRIARRWLLIQAAKRAGCHQERDWMADLDPDAPLRVHVEGPFSGVDASNWTPIERHRDLIEAAWIDECTVREVG